MMDTPLSPVIVGLRSSQTFDDLSQFVLDLSGHLQKLYVLHSLRGGHGIHGRHFSFSPSISCTTTLQGSIRPIKRSD
jgi:hypothetical protein